MYIDCVFAEFNPIGNRCALFSTPPDSLLSAVQPYSVFIRGQNCAQAVNNYQCKLASIFLVMVAKLPSESSVNDFRQTVNGPIGTVEERCLPRPTQSLPELYRGRVLMRP